jgi:hypothetical protein
MGSYGMSLALKEGCYRTPLPIMGSYETPLALKEGCYGTPLPIMGLVDSMGNWAYRAHSMIHNGFHMAFPPSF